MSFFIEVVCWLKKCECFIEVVKDEIYVCGFVVMMIVCVVEVVDVLLGNVYYYFKMKDDFVWVVIDDYFEYVDRIFDEVGFVLMFVV